MRADRNGPTSMAARGDQSMKTLTITVLRIIGIVLILIGLVGAYYGPLEIYVFYLFSEGGPFHYDGFGVGSLGFAALVVQNIGYYIIAALLIPVGIGHLKMHRWALTLTQLYSWFWLGAGILLTGNLIALLPSAFRLDLSRNVLYTRLAIVGVSSLVLMVLAPVLALWFYRSTRVRSIFEDQDPNEHWTERYPLPLPAVLLLFAIAIIVMHIAVFLQAMFPMFGRIGLGRQSVYVISLNILILGILVYGVIRLRMWAWWGSVVYLALLAVSTTMTFIRYSFRDIVLLMKIPASEVAVFDNLILVHDYRFVGVLAPPLLIALRLVVSSRRYFVKSDNRAQLTTS